MPKHNEILDEDLTPKPQKETVDTEKLDKWTRKYWMLKEIPILIFNIWVLVPLLGESYWLFSLIICIFLMPVIVIIAFFVVLLLTILAGLFKKENFSSTLEEFGTKAITYIPIQLMVAGLLLLVYYWRS